MILLSGFLDVFFRALVFVGLALSVGGIVFRYVVLSPTRAGLDALRRSAGLIALGAFVVAGAGLAALVTDVSALADETGRWPIAEFLGTGFARAALIHALLGLILGCVGLAVRRNAMSSLSWALAAAAGAAFTTAGAWLVHGASRLDNATALMTVTVIHQFAAAAWIGGTIHLTAQWRLLPRDGLGDSIWPEMTARFSPLALGSVALLLAAGFYLSQQYIRDFGGLVGTAYGFMVLTKIALMVCVLYLGRMNFYTIRRWKATGDRRELLRRVPVFAEMEAAIGIIILMAAAALTGQPPAVDIVSQRATPAEVVRAFAPKMPQLAPPPHAKMLVGAASSLDQFALPTELQKVQSDFNHNVSGIFIIIIGLTAFIDRSIRARWARHWPLLFLPFAVFLVIVAEPNGWPLGPEGFWSTLIAPEVLQHRLATFLLVGMAYFQWRAVTSGESASRRYMFPVLCLVGGAVLLTHSHSVFSIKRAFLIESSHNVIGILAVLMGAGGWLELKMQGREGRIAGVLWPICFVLVGMVLLFYRET